MNTRWLTFVVVLLCVTVPVAASTDVSFKAADGFALTGTFYPVDKGGPAILLLHQCNADRRIYEQLATMLNAAGYNVLAFDFRGFGGSRAGNDTDLAANRQRIITLIKQLKDKPDLRAFYDSDLRWLRHYGFQSLEVPSMVAGLQR